MAIDHRSGRWPRRSRGIVGQALRFGITTCVSAAITVGVPVVLHEGFAVAPAVATAIAFTGAFIVNFLTMRLLVFRSKHGMRRDLTAFVVSSVAFRIAEYLAFLLLHVVCGVNYVLGLFTVLAVSTVAKFLWYRWLMGEREAVARS